MVTVDQTRPVHWPTLRGSRFLQLCALVHVRLSLHLASGRISAAPRQYVSTLSLGRLWRCHSVSVSAPSTVSLCVRVPPQPSLPEEGGDEQTRFSVLSPQARFLFFLLTQMASFCLSSLVFPAHSVVRWLRFRGSGRLSVTIFPFLKRWEITHLFPIWGLERGGCGHLQHTLSLP